MIGSLSSPTIFHTLSAAMLRLAFADNAPGRRHISVFSFLCCCTFCLPRMSQHKMIQEDNAGDNGASATVGTESRAPDFNIWYWWLNNSVKSFLHISTVALECIMCHVGLLISCVCWLLPMCTSCLFFMFWGSYITFSVSSSNIQ